MASLPDLKAACDSAAALVVDLKKSAGSPDSIKAAVTSLLAAKTAYAAANGGIGPDGKPFDPAGGKKDKKKKDAGAVAANSVANAPTAESLAKKAAKKEADKAKKAAAKAAVKGGADAPPAAPGGGGGAAAAAAAVAAAAPPAAPKAAAAAPAKSSKKSKAVQFGKVEPLQLCFSPNAGTPAPFLTLFSAAFLSLDPDLKLKMDIHRSAAPALGTHGKGTTADAVIQGDLTCARYFLSTHPRSDLVDPFLGANAIARARVDEWIEYSLAAKASGASSSLLTSIAAALDSNNSTFLAGPSLTLADVAAFDALGGGARVTSPGSVDTSNFPPSALRWFTSLDESSTSLKARHLVAGVDGSTELFGAEFPAANLLSSLVPGCGMLEGALPHQVCTRFPPEPSGYLHIGHAKAVLLNDYYATRYKGKLIVRFDDTNPSKEKEEYQQSIVEDLAKLGVFPTIVTYTSDYFKELRGYALDLVKEGKAYMDDTPQEEMQTERMARQNSKRRELTVEENLKFFEAMEEGSEEGAKWCLRGKVDMQVREGEREREREEEEEIEWLVERRLGVANPRLFFLFFLFFLAFAHFRSLTHIFSA